LLQLEIPQHGDAPLKVLCLGAHADDLEIGCGGTIAALLEARSVIVHWVVLSAVGSRLEEAHSAASRVLAKATEKQIVTMEFRDGYFPFCGADVKACFEELKSKISPDLIFTHYRDDLHQDHRLVSELTWNTFRDHLILEYEIPKYDGDLGNPNAFMPLTPEACTRKISCILESFATQRDRHWFNEETFRALLRLRGIECRSETGYAEAFYARKATLAISRG